MNHDAKKILKIASLSVFFVFIIFYALLRSKDLILGVKIKDVNIENGTTLENSVLPISGNAKNAIYLSINGREISVDQLGNFNETIVLLPGYNVVKIKARDKFEHIDEKDYQLIYSAPTEKENI